MEDLFAAKAFMDHALTVSEPGLLEALGIAGLIKFLRCFESTSGLRIKPLKLSKIFNHEDRARVKALIWTRHKFVVHDEQTHPMKQSVLLVDSDGEAIDVMVTSSKQDFRTFAVSEDLPRLIELALEYVRTAHLSAGDAIKSDWNAQSATEKRVAARGNREVVIDILREDGDETPKDASDFSQQLAYIIPKEVLSK
ncbi:hypothetical protein D3Y57_16560 [Sphingomonas paeninsulae]|uniref:Uncharacterized protein n=2 Tax=Sphingomonas paeninsulae TaxID=2319844 RepID=A0A494TN59_SPHPE|nr:hypothetical protein D3Y57_16560 [Sphingomonas paeninsulae]